MSTQAAGLQLGCDAAAPNPRIFSRLCDERLELRFGSIEDCSDLRVGGSVIATWLRLRLGRVTPSLGSDAMTRSRTAARRTAFTWLYRVWIVPGARPRPSISLTHCLMFERRTVGSGESVNGTDSAASFIAFRVCASRSPSTGPCSTG